MVRGVVIPAPLVTGIDALICADIIDYIIVRYSGCGFGSKRADSIDGVARFLSLHLKEDHFSAKRSNFESVR